MDDKLNIPFDAILNKVTVEGGIYGMFNFFKIQLIRQIDSDIIVLFTRWGRVGLTGQFQKSAFPNLKDGIVEFKKIFKQKTGNQWDSVKNFSPVAGKFRVVPVERRFLTEAKQYKIDLDNSITSLPTTLSKPVFDVVETLIKIHTNGKSLGLGWENKQITKEALLKATETLSRIESLQSRMDSVNDKSGDTYKCLVNQIVEGSEEFYHLIPVDGLEYEKLTPVLDTDKLREKQRLVHDLSHIEFANELLLGAQHRSGDISPVDYVYHSLGTQLEQLEPSEYETQLILQYINNSSSASSKNVKIHCIYRVVRNCETSAESSSTASKTDNPWLLWHGSKSQNVLSILSQGLQVEPLGSDTNGGIIEKVYCFLKCF